MSDGPTIRESRRNELRDRLITRLLNNGFDHLVAAHLSVREDPQGSNTQLFRGQVLHGFCGGYFGRDAYECKTVKATGVDWIVVRDTDGYVWLATGHDIHQDLARYRTPGLGTCSCGSVA